MLSRSDFIALSNAITALCVAPAGYANDVDVASRLSIDALPNPELKTYRFVLGGRG